MGESKFLSKNESVFDKNFQAINGLDLRIFSLQEPNNDSLSAGFSSAE